MSVIEPGTPQPHRSYPPEPWHLRGQMHASIFVMPLAAVPVELPPGCRPVRIGGRSLVATAWVSYEPGGVLSYRELMATVLVRRGFRLLPTIIAIWVDSEASLEGGRALWGIPKELASFAFDGANYAVETAAGPIARSRIRRRFTLPGRWPVRFSVVQRLHLEAKVSAIRSRARIEFAAVDVHATPGGPLGFLAGRRPLLSVTLRNFEMTFGG